MVRFYDAIKEKVINQRWGHYDPVTYLPFGFTLHNGRDLGFRDKNGNLVKNKNIEAPFDYTVVRKGFQPEGGGIFLGIISDFHDFPAFTCITPEGLKIDFKAGRYRILTDFLHLKSTSVNEGAIGKAGDLLAIGNNTGKSTGSHCHEQDRRVLWDGKTFTTVDTNDANNSFDPEQVPGLMVGMYAQDISKVTQIQTTLVGVLYKLIGLLTKS